MLPRTHRLRDKKRIEEVFSEKKIITPIFSVWKKRIDPPAKLMVIVSTKVSKKASERNLVRRRIQEAFRSLMSETPADLSVIISAHKKCLSSNYKEIKEELLKVFSK